MELLNKFFRKYFIVFFIPALFFAGCGVWEDFTTYFNLYYNTSDLFEEAEKTIYSEQRELFSTEELKIPGSAEQLLTKVVEKASKILQFHGESAFVDDALSMLGKSLYYQKNYQKSIRKFQELISTQPNSDLVMETQLWIAKNEMRLQNYKDGIDLLHAVRDTAMIEGEDDILQEAFVEEIIYYIAEENYSNAITITNEFLNAADDDVIKAEIYYELGKLYSENDDIENSIASLREVNNYSPTYFTEVRASIQLAKSLRLNKQPEEGLYILEDMGDQQKFSDNFPEIDYETGVTLAELNRNDEALEMLTYVDTSYASTPFSGMAKFKKGEMYENHYKDFDSASFYYGRSAGTNMPPEYVLQANAKIVLFKKYNQLRATLDDQNRSMVYIIYPDSFIQDSVNYYYDSLEVEGELAYQDANQEDLNDDFTEGQRDNRRIPPGNQDNQVDPRSRTQGTTPSQNIDTQKKPPVRPDISEDSLKIGIAKTEFELGNLFFTEFNLPDSAFVYYSDIVENHPKSIYFKNSLFGLGSYYDTKGDSVTADSIFTVIYDTYKTDPIVNAAARKINKPYIDLEYDPAKDLYSEAEKLLIEKNYQESVNKFIDISNSYPESKLAPKALFAGGWVLENELKMYDSAAVIYDSVKTRYPNSVYAQDIKSKVDLYKNEMAQRQQAQQLEEQKRLQAEQQQQDSLNAPAGTISQPVQTELNGGQQVQPDSTGQTEVQRIEQEIQEAHQSEVDSLNRVPADRQEENREEPNGTIEPPGSNFRDD